MGLTNKISFPTLKKMTRKLTLKKKLFLNGCGNLRTRIDVQFLINKSQRNSLIKILSMAFVCHVILLEQV